MVALYAYAISRDNFKFKTFFTFFAFFTMLFGGGLVAYYMVTRQILQIQNTLWALFLPSAFSPFWVIVMRTFYKANVPNEIIESARIDGASEWRTLFQIVIPLSAPGSGDGRLVSARSASGTTSSTACCWWTRQSITACSSPFTQP